MDDKATVSAFKDFVDDTGASSAAAPQATQPTATATASASAPSPSPSHSPVNTGASHAGPLSPAVMYHVATNKIEVSKIRGTGPKGVSLQPTSFPLQWRLHSCPLLFPFPLRSFFH